VSLGIKNWLNQIALTCKARLLDRHKEKLVLVEEFITEIEGSDPTSWNQSTDLKRSDVEMRGRVDAAFEKWLKPSS
jgi:NMD protein affecting ribosome stability and mRNA decay